MRRFIAVDDCGPRINPMIVEGQVHGGLADGIGMALMQVIAFDEDGNCLGGSFMDYLLPTVDGVPELGARRDGHAVAAPPARAQGRRRVRDRRFAARRGQRGDRRDRAVRGPARRHAADPGAGVAGDAGHARCAPTWPSRERAAARRSREPRPIVDDRGRRAAARRGRAVRPGPGGARRAADLGEAGRRGDRPRRRLDRGVRRRQLRRDHGAGAEPDAARSGEPLLLRITPGRRARPAGRDGDGRCTTRACPAAPWRSSSSRWCRRRWSRSSATARSPGAARGRRVLGYDVRRLGALDLADTAAVVVASHGRDEDGR